MKYKAINLVHRDRISVSTQSKAKGELLGNKLRSYMSRQIRVNHNPKHDRAHQQDLLVSALLVIFYRRSRIDDIGSNLAGPMSGADKCPGQIIHQIS